MSRPRSPAATHSESAPEAADHAQVAYNVRHERPWGWRVSAYLLTKSLSAGLFLALTALLTAQVKGAHPAGAARYHRRDRLPRPHGAAAGR